MLFSEEYKFIFVHVSKTGGSNLELALLPYVRQPAASLKNKILRVSRLGNYRNHLFKQHDTAAYAKSILPKDVFEQCFKFALARNPWDLLVSLYLFLRRMESHRHHTLVNKMSFEDFVDFEIKRNSRHQHTFALDRHGNMLLDYVGRFERLEEEFDRVCDRLGVARPQLEKRGVYKRAAYQEYYDQKLRDKVAGHWAKDIAVFGYEYEEFDHGDIVENYNNTRIQPDSGPDS